MLVGGFVLAIMRGALVPRSTHDDVIHDRNEWRAESRIKDAQLTEKDVQLRHLGEVGRTIEQLLGSAQRARLENREGSHLEGDPT